VVVQLENRRRNLKKNNIVLFPTPTAPISEATFNYADAFDEAIAELEKRLGGAKIADLENGDEKAAKIAQRSLRKEYFKMLSEDLKRGDK